MSTFKLTTNERERIRSWVEKRPESSDLPKDWAFQRDDGTELVISRVTQYLPPSNRWKVRIAYILDTGYPILMSGPLVGGADTKKAKPKPTLKKKAAIKKAHGKTVAFKIEPPTPKKGSFAKALNMEMKALEDFYLAQTQSWLDNTNPLISDEVCHLCGDGFGDCCAEGAP